MLSIGLNYSTTDTTAYFRCLSLLSECPRRAPTEFLFRMEPHRGTPALQKLTCKGLNFDDLQAQLCGLFFEEFDLLVAVSVFVILHSFIYVLLTILQHPVH